MRTLQTLDTVIAAGADHSAASIARDLDMPVATVHRQITSLIAAGYLWRGRNGRCIAGPRLLRLSSQFDKNTIVTEIARPILDSVGARMKTTVHLGTLDADMVTYRLKAGDNSTSLFTRVGLQLEAYCSAMGKVLLSHLPVDRQRSYLSSEPFIALTPNTIVEPKKLEKELKKVREQGFARDEEEIQQGLTCIAVPVRTEAKEVTAAISASWHDATARTVQEGRVISLLREAAEEIERQWLAWSGEQ
jgi:DNA-binding IclR family transcriptional regulator